MLPALFTCLRSIYVSAPFRLQLAAFAVANLSQNNMAAPAEINVSIGYCGA